MIRGPASLELCSKCHLTSTPRMHVLILVLRVRFCHLKFLLNSNKRLWKFHMDSVYSINPGQHVPPVFFLCRYPIGPLYLSGLFSPMSREAPNQQLRKILSWNKIREIPRQSAFVLDCVCMFVCLICLAYKLTGTNGHSVRESRHDVATRLEVKGCMCNYHIFFVACVFHMLRIAYKHFRIHHEFKRLKMQTVVFSGSFILQNEFLWGDVSNSKIHD